MIVGNKFILGRRTDGRGRPAGRRTGQTLIYRYLSKMTTNYALETRHDRARRPSGRTPARCSPGEAHSSPWPRPAGSLPGRLGSARPATAIWQPTRAVCVGRIGPYGGWSVTWRGRFRVNLTLGRVTSVPARGGVAPKPDNFFKTSENVPSE